MNESGTNLHLVVYFNASLPPPLCRSYRHSHDQHHHHFALWLSYLIHLTHPYFAERNVLGKPMSRAIQNDIQNIQKMLDKDIEDSSLSGKTSSHLSRLHLHQFSLT